MEGVRRGIRGNLRETYLRLLNLIMLTDRHKHVILHIEKKKAFTKLSPSMQEDRIVR